MLYKPALPQRRIWMFSLSLLLAFIHLPFLPEAQSLAAMDGPAARDVDVPGHSTAWRNLARRFAVFGSLEQGSADAYYAITLCADLPDNDRPQRVHVRDETGHVFIILSLFDPQYHADTLFQVYGFYPRRPVSSVIFKNARSEVLNSDGREYNASISLPVSRETFRQLIQQSLSLSTHKYNINKFNCYDYALRVFNSIPNLDSIPVHHVRFPFIFGKGGSPCGLYADLKKMKESGRKGPWQIQFGLFRAPVSSKPATGEDAASPLITVQ